MERDRATEVVVKTEKERGKVEKGVCVCDGWCNLESPVIPPRRCIDPEGRSTSRVLRLRTRE